MQWEGRISRSFPESSAESGVTRSPSSSATSVAMIADPPELVTISIRGPLGGGT